MNQAGADDPEHGDEDNGKHRHRETAHSANGAIEEKDDQYADGSGQGADAGVIQARDEIVRIFGETDAGGGNRERSDKDGFPQEEEGHHAAPGTGIKGFAEVDVGPAGAGHGGAEFRIHHSIANGKDGSKKPTEDG